MNQIIWTPGVSLEDIEEQVIKKAYLHFSHNKLATANSLGISERTLHTKLKQYEEFDKKRIEEEAERKKKSDEYLLKCRGMSSVSAKNEGVWFSDEKEKPKDEVLKENTTSLKPKGNRVIK